MKRCMMLGALAMAGLLAAAEIAQAQFGFSYGRGYRGGRSYGVSTPFFSAGYSRGYRGYGYGYPYYGGYYGGYDGRGYYPRRGYSFSFGSPAYYDSGYWPGYSYSSGWSRRGYVMDSDGYVVDGGERTSTQAFYSGGADPDQALIRVRVPDPDAVVFFEGERTRQKGTDRVFSSPSLEEGRTYTYTVKASWEDENGRNVTREKEVEIRAGEQAIVSFAEGREERVRGERLGQPAQRREEIRERRGVVRGELDANFHVGTVVRARDGELFMKMGETGEEHSHRLAPDAQILIDGKKANLEDLKAGMRIEVTTKEGDEKIATKIEVKERGERKDAQPPD